MGYINRAGLGCLMVAFPVFERGRESERVRQSQGACVRANVCECAVTRKLKVGRSIIPECMLNASRFSIVIRVRAHFREKNTQTIIVRGIFREKELVQF